MTKTIYSAGYRRLIDYLRARRAQQAVTQSALSAQLGWPQQRLSAIETGARRLDIIEFLHLTGSLGLEPEEAIRVALELARPARRHRPSRGPAKA